MKGYWNIHVYLLIGLCLAAPACKQAKQVADITALKEETRDEFFGNTFRSLHEGGRLYLGTIESVTVSKREEAGFAVEEESGKFTVRVQEAVRGPVVNKLHLSYFFDDYDPNEPNAALLGDRGGRGAWTRRPCVGEQLLLLLTLDTYRRAEQNWEKDGDATHVWVGIGPDHPLVKEFEVAVRYLETHDKPKRFSYFRLLCRSSWPSIRDFARDAAFYEAYDSSSKQKAEDENWNQASRLMVEYVKTARAPLKDWERLELTRTLRSTLCFVSCWDTEHRPFADWVSRHANDEASEWLSTFEDWYLTELGSDAMRPNPERSKQVLIELRTLFHHYGVAGSVAFFRKRGLPGLEERLKVCTRSPDPYLATNAKQWLDILRAGRKIAANTVTNCEGDLVSLQTVYLDTLMHMDTIYRADNLPPGVGIDPATGVISGRLKEGASKNSPYKVSVFYGPQQRQHPAEENRTKFSWQVRPRASLDDRKD